LCGRACVSIQNWNRTARVDSSRAARLAVRGSIPTAICPNNSRARRWACSTVTAGNTPSVTRAGRPFTRRNRLNDFALFAVTHKTSPGVAASRYSTRPLAGNGNASIRCLLNLICFLVVIIAPLSLKSHCSGVTPGLRATSINVNLSVTPGKIVLQKPIIPSTVRNIRNDRGTTLKSVIPKLIRTRSQVRILVRPLVRSM
jgi:hypothetical protein